jgi:hypothetical protein
MHINTTPSTNRINPTELRRLRATVATTTICCPVSAIQSAVTTAHVAFGEDWSQEATVLLNEMEYQASQPHLRRA